VEVLLLAPQPFYQERGTPIAVNLLLKTLIDRGDSVDVLCYHEGDDVTYGNSRIIRAPVPGFIRNVRPGFSWKKIVCDIFMVFSALRLVSKKKYQLVHAVEESVYIAVLFKIFFRIPYVYDMDSSLAQQMAEKYPFLRYLSVPMKYFERVAVKNAKAVVPVCDTLARIAKKHGAEKIVILEDISLLNDGGAGHRIDLETTLGINGLTLLYIGNLESYQGIDLLLESFMLVAAQTDRAHLVIVGGEASDIRKYTKMASQLGIENQVYFLGPKPVKDLGAYLAGADILVSPRTKGNNTPMKIYSYLHSGKPIVATDLPTHTQVLNKEVAILAVPDPEKFSEGILRLIENEGLRLEIGKAGQKLAEDRFSYQSFAAKINDLYDQLNRECSSARNG
jgi:glycosyltransferase involved in cell wall biosynthesis